MCVCVLVCVILRVNVYVCKFVCLCLCVRVYVCVLIFGCVVCELVWTDICVTILCVSADTRGVCKTHANQRVYIVNVC